MGKFQIILLLSVVTCAILSTVQSVPVSDSSVDSENAEKCEKLCGFCNCKAYYCGDECLCECNSANDGDAACVDTMKSNCKKLELPFEVLIQGPNMNRMVRSLLYANPEEEFCAQSSESNQKKRSTISIYKPNEIQQHDVILTSPKVADEVAYTNESPIVSVIVARKTDPNVADVESVKTEENVENMDKLTVDVANSQSDNYEMPVADDALDRISIKRHITDVNQDISEDEDTSFVDDSVMFKRGAEEAPKQEETVAAAIPPPAPPAPPAPSMPKLRKIIDSIPSSDEIENAWDSVRKEVNAKINLTIAAAQQKAAELRARLAPPPPAKPASVPAKPSVPNLPAVPPRFNPFGFADKDLGVALNPAAPIIPPAAAIEAQISKNIAAAALSPSAIEAQIAKNIAAARASLLPNRLAKNYRANEFRRRWNTDNWLTPWLVGSTTDNEPADPKGAGDVGAAAPAPPVAEEPKSK